MNDDVKSAPPSAWFSTYGMLTAERILEGFQIHLSHNELVAAVKNPRSIYFHLLRVPLKNVLNGIILEQVHDYQVYAQKVIIEFLVSGENDKQEGSPGGNTRDDLEEARNKLLALGDEYNHVESDHKQLIAESQASLITLASELQQSLLNATMKINHFLTLQRIIKTEDQVKEIIRTAMVYYEDPGLWDKISKNLDITFSEELRNQFSNVFIEFNQQRDRIDQTLETFGTVAEEISNSLKNFRNQFYTLILRVNELIKLVPDYRPNVDRDAENRSVLNFDSKIGE